MTDCRFSSYIVRPRISILEHHYLLLHRTISCGRFLYAAAIITSSNEELTRCVNQQNDMSVIKHVLIEYGGMRWKKGACISVDPSAALISFLLRQREVEMTQTNENGESSEYVLVHALWLIGRLKVPKNFFLITHCIPTLDEFPAEFAVKHKRLSICISVQKL